MIQRQADLFRTVRVVHRRAEVDRHLIAAGDSYGVGRLYIYAVGHGFYNKIKVKIVDLCRREGVFSACDRQLKIEAVILAARRDYRDIIRQAPVLVQRDAPRPISHIHAAVCGVFGVFSGDKEITVRKPADFSGYYMF